MQVQYEHGLWLEVETRNGTEFILASLAQTDAANFGNMVIGRDDPRFEAVLFEVRDYLNAFPEDVLQFSLREGWGVRLSAPGYLDCTDWSVFPTQEEAEQHYREFFCDDCGDDAGPV